MTSVPMRTENLATDIYRGDQMKTPRQRPSTSQGERPGAHPSLTVLRRNHSPTPWWRTCGLQNSETEISAKLYHLQWLVLASLRNKFSTFLGTSSRPFTYLYYNATCFSPCSLTLSYVCMFFIFKPSLLHSRESINKLLIKYRRKIKGTNKHAVNSLSV